MATGERETRRNRGRERRRWRERGWGERRIASSHLATEQPTHARTHRRTLFFTYSPSIFSIKKTGPWRHREEPAGIAPRLLRGHFEAQSCHHRRGTSKQAKTYQGDATKHTKCTMPGCASLTLPEHPITVAQEGFKTRGLHYQGQPPLTGSMEACCSRGHRQRG